MTDRPIPLAVITGAHGVAGEVRLKLFADSLDSLKVHKSFNDGTLALKALRQGPNGPLARIDGVNDRTAAEKLRGTELTVPRSALPPLETGEYYHFDLIGLPAVSTDGVALGMCVAVENFGAGDVLEIERPDTKRFMVPMNDRAVPDWDADRIVIDAAFAA